MSVFFVHDPGLGIVAPLDRKFRVRDIPPTEPVQSTNKIHEKAEPDPYQSATQSKKAAQHYSKEALEEYTAQRDSTNSQQFGRVKDIMSKPVLTIQSSQSLLDAWYKLEKYEISHLLIMSDTQQYCGMLSEKKMMPLLMREQRIKPEDLELTVFCDEQPLSTHPDTLITDLAPALLELGLDAIAVYDNTKIVGIVTYSDILKVILKSQALRIHA